MEFWNMARDGKSIKPLDEMPCNVFPDNSFKK